MSTIFLIFSGVLLLWVFVLHLQTKKLAKDLSDIVRWSAYLETTIKDAGILVFNSNKGKHGEWEISNKLIDLLK